MKLEIASITYAYQFYMYIYVQPDHQTRVIPKKEDASRPTNKLRKIGLEFEQFGKIEHLRRCGGICALHVV